jgi:hypothetical protein
VAGGVAAGGVLLCASAVLDDFGHFYRVASAADMHIKSCRAGAQQMIVDRRNLESALEQFCHDWIDLRFEQNEVAHHHCLVMHRHERDPTAERERRLDRHAVERYLEVGARESVAMDFS